MLFLFVIGPFELLWTMSPQGSALWGRGRGGLAGYVWVTERVPVLAAIGTPASPSAGVPSHWLCQGITIRIATGLPWEGARAWALSQ